MSAPIIPLFVRRDCRRCGMPCDDSPGNHCMACINELPPLPLSFMHSTVASVIRDIEKLKPSDPLRVVLFQMRQLYDVVTPRVHAPQLGSVRFDEGSFWAAPEDTSESIGPFSTPQAAGLALIERVQRGEYVGD